MKFELKLDTKKIEQKLNKNFDGLIHKVTELINGDVLRANVIPYDKGDLQNTSFVKTVNNDVSEIHYPQKYAVRMWYGESFTFQKAHNANATHHWALPFMTPQRIQAYTKAFLKQKGM